jgi:outer membrane protein X
MGGLLRGGFEWGKFRMGLEWPSTKIHLARHNGNSRGTISKFLFRNSKVLLVGGKWGK